MSQVRRFDHVGITVADRDAVTAFFVGLGLQCENRMFVEGEFGRNIPGSPSTFWDSLGGCIPRAAPIRVQSRPWERIDSRFAAELTWNKGGMRRA